MAVAAQLPDTDASTHRGAIETNRGGGENNGHQMAVAAKFPDAGTSTHRGAVETNGH